MVQATMVSGALLAGDRPSISEWFGWLLAVAGFVYLLFPGLTAPSVVGSGLMGLAGVAWGVYTLRGRTESDALGGTTYNFLRSVPLVLVVGLVSLRDLNLSREGIILAAVSGALTSGIGYVIWYAALMSLSSMQAAMVQTAVPVIAASGGVLFLSESISMRLAISGFLILGGICLAVRAKESGVTEGGNLR